MQISHHHWYCYWKSLGAGITVHTEFCFAMVSSTSHSLLMGLLSQPSLTTPTLHTCLSLIQPACYSLISCDPSSLPSFFKILWTSIMLSIVRTVPKLDIVYTHMRGMILTYTLSISLPSPTSNILTSFLQSVENLCVHKIPSIHYNVEGNID